MKIVIEFSRDNAAFNGMENKDAIMEVMNVVKEKMYSFALYEGHIIDYNGNIIGNYKVTEN